MTRSGAPSASPCAAWQVETRGDAGRWVRARRLRGSHRQWALQAPHDEHGPLGPTRSASGHRPSVHCVGRASLRTSTGAPACCPFGARTHWPDGDGRRRDAGEERAQAPEEAGHPSRDAPHLLGLVPRSAGRRPRDPIHQRTCHRSHATALQHGRVRRAEARHRQRHPASRTPHLAPRAGKLPVLGGEGSGDNRGRGGHRRPAKSPNFYRFSEREKRFELSTSTLARLHSTTELLPRRSVGLDGPAVSVNCGTARASRR